MREAILDKNGNVIGFIESNHHQTFIMDRHCNYKGYYSTSTGYTHKMNGDVLYRGNMLSMLLNQ